MADSCNDDPVCYGVSFESQKEEYVPVGRQGGGCTNKETALVRKPRLIRPCEDHVPERRPWDSEMPLQPKNATFNAFRPTILHCGRLNRLL